ncbi:MAG: hypothetical protein PVH77_05280, partial [Phycisphaerales bacterium]
CPNKHLYKPKQPFSYATAPHKHETNAKTARFLLVDNLLITRKFALKPNIKSKKTKGGSLFSP